MVDKKTHGLFELIEKNQEELEGIEYNKDDDDLENDSVFSEREIRVSQKMVTVYMVEHWIESGLLNLRPDYQRNLVWDIKRKSALIESLLLNIPIPAFYFDEDSTGRKSVIDGLQRLSAIHQYINDEFRLKNLQYLSACEQKIFSELDIRHRAKIFETMLMVNILDERCSPMIKMDIFRRVNTGGIHLNPQEIRNIMANSAVRKLLIDMSTCNEFLLATNGKVNDIRMGAQELCLRYITILSSFSWEYNDFEYFHGLIKMMDACILTLNKAEMQALEIILKQFKKIMNQCYIILEEYSFCKLDNKRINKALFTSWAVVLYHYNLEDDSIKKHKEIIRKKYVWVLKNDREFYNSITSSTGSRKYISYAIKAIRRVMEECYDF